MSWNILSGGDLQGLCAYDFHHCNKFALADVFSSADSFGNKHVCSQFVVLVPSKHSVSPAARLTAMVQQLFVCVFLCVVHDGFLGYPSRKIMTIATTLIIGVINHSFPDVSSLIIESLFKLIDVVPALLFGHPTFFFLSAILRRVLLTAGSKPRRGVLCLAKRHIWAEPPIFLRLF